MGNENKKLHYLHELSDYKVDANYPDVRGWQLRSTAGEIIGEVEGLLVDKAAKKVVYLDVKAEHSITTKRARVTALSTSQDNPTVLKNARKEHVIIPIAMIELDKDNQEARCMNISNDIFSHTKRFVSGSNVARNNHSSLFLLF